MKYICAGLLLIGSLAAVSGAPVSINSPEVDGSTAAGAITLISGAVVVLRSRRRKR